MMSIPFDECSYLMMSIPLSSFLLVFLFNDEYSFEFLLMSVPFLGFG